MKLVTLIAFMVLLPACAGAQEPDFQIGIWPGEGIPRFEATGEPLTLREEPTESAAVARAVRDLRPGTPIEYDDTRYQTLQPGRLAVLAAATVSGRNLGDIRFLSREDYYRGGQPREERAVAAGDTIDFLQYRAEGTRFVRIEADVIDADFCPTHLAKSFRLDSEPRLAWWIRVVLDDSPAGWLLVEDATVRQGRRGF